jgi:hypothetical protein
MSKGLKRGEKAPVRYGDDIPAMVTKQNPWNENVPYMLEEKQVATVARIA